MPGISNNIPQYSVGYNHRSNHLSLQQVQGVDKQLSIDTEVGPS